MSILKLTDDDTGESGLDVVEVPEGVSLQMYLKGEEGYISVVIGSIQARQLADFLLHAFV